MIRLQRSLRSACAPLVASSFPRRLGRIWRGSTWWSSGHNFMLDTAFLASPQTKVDEEPTSILQRHAKELMFHRKTTVHNDLDLKSFLCIPHYLLTTTLKERCIPYFTTSSSNATLSLNQ
ncbi:unnamed protein product [Lepeophtheirus salmonis]|uniref:(salmon louse) hypothetical protein n=1 Tax=Lepeophtheirus salmonis TaxID=72036 RepID=A0A7R8CFD2_LEPSM|nr:unnamed protein product [Lepeophtheirus salmonis]CAF2798731.1 unnamed protein product [Lepeophtheirus salmonis]